MRQPLLCTTARYKPREIPKLGSLGVQLGSFWPLSFFIGVVISVPREQGISGVAVGLNSGPCPALGALRKSPTDISGAAPKAAHAWILWNGGRFAPVSEL